MREILFLSHANPEDNQFTVWLASRLQLLGYQVWCDIRGLVGGEIQWEVIDDMIRNRSAKFLLVVSKDLCVKPGQLKEGISKEYHLAESMAKKHETDFIIPLKIDSDSSYDDFIGLNRYNHISFKENWASGLKTLVKKLDKDTVPKSEPSKNKLLTDWYNNEFTTKHGLVEKKETYFINIWEIEELWDTFTIYVYENATIAEQIRKINDRTPIIRHGSSIATFGDAQLSIQEESPIATYQESFVDSFTINISDLLSKKYVSDTFPSTLDCENILKRLLNRSFHLMARERGLFWFELSSKRISYFYPRGRMDKVTFTYNEKKKTKNLTGKYKEGYWHFGVTAKAILSPTLGFVLKSHILFSDDGSKIWNSKERLHSARRKKGRSWFNEEWRDQIFAFINSLKNDAGKIEMRLSSECIIDMPEKLLKLFSPVGYNEPTTKEPLVILEKELKEELDEGSENENV